MLRKSRMCCKSRQLSVFHVYGKNNSVFLYCICSLNIQKMLVDLGVLQDLLLHYVFLIYKEAANGYVSVK